MRAHPIIDYPYRWFPMLVLALVLAIIQATLSWGYAGVDWLPAIIDGITTIGWFAALAYLAWFVVGYVSILQTKVITVAAGILLWIAGSFMICDIMVRIAGIPYISFASTIPFRLLFWRTNLDRYHFVVSTDSSERSRTGRRIHSTASSSRRRKAGSTRGNHRPYYSKGRFTYTHNQSGRTTLHPGMRRLRNPGYPNRRIHQGTNHEVFRRASADKQFCTYPPFHYCKRDTNIPG